MIEGAGPLKDPQRIVAASQILLGPIPSARGRHGLGSPQKPIHQILRPPRALRLAPK